MIKTRLFVSGLTEDTSSLDLHDLFSTFGEVLSAKAWIDLNIQKCKGWGFVEMARERDAYSAMMALNGEWRDGKHLRVKESTT